MKLPGFLIVGTAKSGTSSLYRFLNAHPDIYLPPVKDLYFFSGLDDFSGPKDDKYRAQLTQSFEAYQSFFTGTDDYPVVGEIATDYLYTHQRSIPAIREHLGEVKILVLLRNPIDRAFSSYLHMLRKGHETLTFTEAIAQESSRRDQGWRWAYRYVDVGLYAAQVKAFIDAFANVEVLFYEEFFRDLDENLKTLYGYLGASQNFVPQTGYRYNVGRVPKNRAIDDLMQRSEKLLHRKKLDRLAGWVGRVSQLNQYDVSLDQSDREALVPRFRDDVAELASLLGRDLDFWDDFNGVT